MLTSCQDQRSTNMSHKADGTNVQSEREASQRICKPVSPRVHFARKWHTPLVTLTNPTHRPILHREITEAQCSRNFHVEEIIPAAHETLACQSRSGRKRVSRLTNEEASHNVHKIAVPDRALVNSKGLHAHSRHSVNWVKSDLLEGRVQPRSGDDRGRGCEHQRECAL